MLLFGQQAFGIELPIRTIGEDFKHWGFTPKKPIRRTYKQRPEAIKACPNLTPCRNHCMCGVRVSSVIT